jgi:hypothetical protein
MFVHGRERKRIIDFNHLLKEKQYFSYIQLIAAVEERKKNLF